MAKQNVRAHRLPGGTAVYTAAAHTFGVDSLLLAAYSIPRPGEKACDLGTGCGIIPLKWYDMGWRGEVTGVEIAPGAAALFANAIRDNGFDGMRSVQADLRRFGTAGYFDRVCMNPPYFKGGPPSPDPERDRARQETGCTLAEVVGTASRLLKNGGRFFLCYRPERIAELFYWMKDLGIEPKRLRPVRQRPESPAPWLFLVQGKKGARPGLLWEPELVMEDGRGAPSLELLEIYGREERS